MKEGTPFRDQNFKNDQYQQFFDYAGFLATCAFFVSAYTGYWILFAIGIIVAIVAYGMVHGTRKLMSSLSAFLLLGAIPLSVVMLVGRYVSNICGDSVGCVWGSFLTALVSGGVIFLIIAKLLDWTKSLHRR